MSGCFAPGVLIFQSFQVLYVLGQCMKHRVTTFPRCVCLVPTQILTSKGISSLRVLFLAYAALQAVLTLVSFLAWPHTFANPLTAPEKLDEAHARVRVSVYVCIACCCPRLPRAHMHE